MSVCLCLCVLNSVRLVVSVGGGNTSAGCVGLWLGRVSGESWDAQCTTVSECTVCMWVCELGERCLHSAAKCGVSVAFVELGYVSVLCVYISVSGVHVECPRRVLSMCWGPELSPSPSLPALLVPRSPFLFISIGCLSVPGLSVSDSVQGSRFLHMTLGGGAGRRAKSLISSPLTLPGPCQP